MLYKSAIREPSEICNLNTKTWKKASKSEVHPALLGPETIKGSHKDPSRSTLFIRYLRSKTCATHFGEIGLDSFHGKLTIWEHIWFSSVHTHPLSNTGFTSFSLEYYRESQKPDENLGNYPYHRTLRLGTTHAEVMALRSSLIQSSYINLPKSY